jgi:hypothetical protein
VCAERQNVPVSDLSFSCQLLRNSDYVMDQLVESDPSMQQLQQVEIATISGEVCKANVALEKGCLVGGLLLQGRWETPHHSTPSLDSTTLNLHYS